MAKRKRRSRRKAQAKRRTGYVLGGVTTAVAAAGAVVWRRFRPSRDDASDNHGD